MSRPTVCFIYRHVPHYRKPFYEGIKKFLLEHGVDTVVVYGQVTGAEATRQDSVPLKWGVPVRNRTVGIGNRELIWQPAYRRAVRADVVVVEQASKLLLNYLLLLRSHALGRPRIALWGHGVNLQTHRASRLGEAAKRVYSTRVDWWFAYNDATVRILRSWGLPEEKITSVQNTIDTTSLRRERDSVRADERAALRARLGLQSSNVGVFTGGLYPEKRLEFLIKAARGIRGLVPDFELVIAGAGPSQGMVRAAADEETWIHYVGPTFGRDLAILYSEAALMLIPGLVGLAVIDAFAMGVPLVTVDLPYHSPEIDYLDPGVNGVMLPRHSQPSDYAHAVARLLDDPAALEALRKGCERATQTYTMENMVERFGTGLLQALGRPV